MILDDFLHPPELQVPTEKTRIISNMQGGWRDEGHECTTQTPVCASCGLGVRMEQRSNSVSPPGGTDTGRRQTDKRQILKAQTRCRRVSVQTLCEQPTLLAQPVQSEGSQARVRH